MNFLDLFFPKFCVNCKKLGDYLCPNCFIYLSFYVANICAVCSHPSIDGMTHPGCRGRYTIDGTFVGLEYNPVMKKLMYQFKYKPYLSDLSKFLSELLYESLIQKEEFAKLIDRKDFVFVPIPLFTSREKSRGYNQSELLAKRLSKKFGLEVKSLLTRIKDTKTQVGQTKKERRENLANAFALQTRNPTRFAKAPARREFEIRNVLLVDDILTTGATLNSAANSLKRAGARRVFGIALAKER